MDHRIDIISDLKQSGVLTYLKIKVGKSRLPGEIQFFFFSVIFPALRIFHLEENFPVEIFVDLAFLTILLGIEFSSGVLIYA